MIENKYLKKRPKSSIDYKIEKQVGSKLDRARSSDMDAHSQKTNNISKTKSSGGNPIK